MNKLHKTMLDILKKTLFYIEEQNEWLSQLQLVITQKEHNYKVLHSLIVNQITEENKKYSLEFINIAKQGDLAMNEELLDSDYEGMTFEISEDTKNCSVDVAENENTNRNNCVMKEEPLNNYNGAKILEIWNSYDFNKVSDTSVSFVKLENDENILKSDIDENFYNTSKTSYQHDNIEESSFVLNIKEDTNKHDEEVLNEPDKDSKIVENVTMKVFQCNQTNNDEEKLDEEKSPFHKKRQNGKTLESFSDISNHKQCKGKLNDEKSFICSYCKKSFNYAHNMKTHLRIHTGEKPFKCSYCSKLFSQKNSLQRHLRLHTGEKPFKCSYCSKSFCHNSSLKYHLGMHTGEKPLKCSYCSKSFLQKCNLQGHLRIHTGEKPFNCYYCSKSFSQKSNLQTHIIHIHTDEKPFKCSTCSKTFATRYILKQHLC